jgi:membrane protease subunit HflC
MNRNRLSLFIGLLLIVVFGLWLFVFQVRQSEVAVVTTFGKVTSDITNSGPQLRLPWPIQKVWIFDQRVQNFEDPLTQGLTRDSFTLLTSVYVGWKITDPKAFFPKFSGSPDPIAEAKEALKRLLGNAKSAVVGKHLLSDFVSATDNGTNFLAIENQILASVASQASSNNYGFTVEFLGFKKIQLPENVTKDVFDRMQAERKKLADKSQYEGEAEAQIIKSTAERKASETLAGAQAQATEIRGRGYAEAAKSLTAFQQDPELANFFFRLDALENSLKEHSILVFDQHTPPFDLFNGVSTNLLISTNLSQIK